MKNTQRGLVTQGVLTLVALALIAFVTYTISIKNRPLNCCHGEQYENMPLTILKIYTDTRNGYSFEYPAKLSISVSEDRVNLSHSIKFDNYDGGCDMKGDSQLSKTLYDFSVSVEILTGTVKPKYVDGTFSNGVLNWEREYMGAEGCGQTKYYSSVDGNKTVVITKQELQDLSPVVAKEVRDRLLAIPGVISYDESTEIIEKILSTFKFGVSNPSSVSEWKTHTNDKYKFSLQYPSSLGIPVDVEQQIEKLDCKSKNYTEVSITSIGNVGLNISCPPIPSMNPYKGTMETTIVSGKNSISFDYTSSTNYHNSEVYIPIDNNLYLMIVSSKKSGQSESVISPENFRKMISSFKFTSPSAPSN